MWKYVPAVHCNPLQTAAKRVMTAAYNSDINPIIFIVGQFHPSSTTLSEKIIQISALSSSWLGQFHPFSTTLSEKIIQLSAISSSWWGNFIPSLFLEKIIQISALSSSWWGNFIPHLLHSQKKSLLAVLSSKLRKFHPSSPTHSQKKIPMTEM